MTFDHEPTQLDADNDATQEWFAYAESLDTERLSRHIADMQREAMTAPIARRRLLDEKIAMSESIIASREDA